ncbi:PhnD/SsuA/transferrin family substrate-binding protein (plasmid) [Burkholderia multivorans]|uniref:PhnD/SsuA/transferrin family substrate-binding protein n=1 Tax=Burkholderia multivorans TaxID=87883 RepID=UPI002019817E|nr:PhnD/SsuA/transferrin family substrate-binding protein [Burkholderia multivorans]MCO1459913.1 PhnD/SsuA/transferrin family substrate-binding protein [Burkholderia multivorans]UQO21324.1 PhnD/SsuA/transferrin family substrate-binding protein [Burkholderia multivorans]
MTINLHRRSWCLNITAAPLLYAISRIASATSLPTSLSSADSSNVTITIGQQGGDTQFGFLASGLFDNTPYQIKWATFQSPTATVSALASGHIDIANGLSQWTAIQAAATATPPWTAATAPYKTVLVTGPDDSVKLDRFVVVASKASGITDIRQGKGKRWGFISGTSLNLFAYVVLHKLGWSKQDVQIITLDSTNQVLALESGLVDIAFTVTDNLPAALQQGARVLGTAHDYGLTLFTGFVANTHALNDPLKGNAIEDFVRRLVLYQNWLVLHPKEAQDALVHGLHLTPVQAALVWKYTRLTPLAPENILDSSQQLTDFAFSTGLIRQRVNAAALLDNRFAEVIQQTVNSSHFAANLKASYQ